MSADHDDRALNFCSIRCHFVRSKCMFLKLQYHGKRFSQTSAWSRWSSKQILSDHMCFCSIIWSVIGLINDPDQLIISLLTIEIWRISPSLISLYSLPRRCPWYFVSITLVSGKICAYLYCMDSAITVFHKKTLKLLDNTSKEILRQGT